MLQSEKQFYDRFVPRLAVEAIQQSTYKRKDDLYCILHIIYQKNTSFRNKLEQYHRYSEVAQSTFKKVISSPNNVSAGLTWLKQNDIIDCNESFCFTQGDTFTKRYMIKDEFLSIPIPVTIKDKGINTNIRKYMVERETQREINIMFSKTNYYKNFKIDAPKAKEFLINETVSKLLSLCLMNEIKLNKQDLIEIVTAYGEYQKKRIKFIGVSVQFNRILHSFILSYNKILAIEKGYLYFKRNATNGRLDTNLTNLPTNLRQFLIGKETLFNIDIKNSQPFFLYCLLKQDILFNNESELNKYGELVVNGGFYEYLAERYEAMYGKVKQRSQIKNMLFEIFFSKTNSYPKTKEFFAGEFPSIMAYINRTNFIEHNTLANKLSSLESLTIISVIIPELGKLNIKPFTIHDSFVCSQSEVEKVVEVIGNRLIEMYDIKPSLHVKTLVDDTVEEQIEDYELIEDIVEMEIELDFQNKITILKKNDIDLDQYRFKREI